MAARALMDDREAKEILDFLAERTGYEAFIIYWSTSMDKYIAATCNKADQKYGLYINTSYASYMHWFSVDVSRKDAYAEVLEKILGISSKGLQVLAKTSVFLPANTSLEQLKIEADLARQDLCSIS